MGGSVVYFLREAAMSMGTKLVYIVAQYETAFFDFYPFLPAVY